MAEDALKAYRIEKKKGRGKSRTTKALASVMDLSLEKKEDDSFVDLGDAIDNEENSKDRGTQQDLDNTHDYAQSPAPERHQEPMAQYHRNI